MIDVSVVGSLHLDIMVEAPRLPQRDETLMGSSWRYKCGGKGGNQAVAAARFGAVTSFGGQTGRDDFGERLRANLVAAGVDISSVGIDETRGSGMSVAISEAGGEYGAVVVSGANLSLDAKTLTALWSCKVLLLQNEIPEAINIAAAQEARARGAKVILNAAPARELTEPMLSLTDLLVVNRIEAAMLSGMDQPEPALRALASPSRDIVLTLGSEGLLVLDRLGAATAIAALSVRMISAHGAGDCFCGALAARLAKGDPLLAACHYARTAAGLFVSTPEDRRHTVDAAAVDSYTR